MGGARFEGFVVEFEETSMIVGGPEGGALAGRLNAWRLTTLLVVKMRKEKVSILGYLMMVLLEARWSGRRRAWHDSGVRAKGARESGRRHAQRRSRISRISKGGYRGRVACRSAYLSIYLCALCGSYVETIGSSC